MSGDQESRLTLPVRSDIDIDARAHRIRAEQRIPEFPGVVFVAEYPADQELSIAQLALELARLRYELDQILFADPEELDAILEGLHQDHPVTEWGRRVEGRLDTLEARPTRPPTHHHHPAPPAGLSYRYTEIAGRVLVKIEAPDYSGDPVDAVDHAAGAPVVRLLAPEVLDAMAAAAYRHVVMAIPEDRERSIRAGLIEALAAANIVVPVPPVVTSEPAETSEDLGREWARSNEALRDVLLLVEVDVPMETIEGWNYPDALAAFLWATAVHASASDDESVSVPERPAFLPEQGGFRRGD